MYIKWTIKWRRIFQKANLLSKYFLKHSSKKNLFRLNNFAYEYKRKLISHPNLIIFAPYSTFYYDLDMRNITVQPSVHPGIKGIVLVLL